MNAPRHFIPAILIILIVASCKSSETKDEWTELFNGKDFTGWKTNETPESFKVVDGVIVANGQRSHLFYVGEGSEPATFKNFEMSLDVMTHHLANSGVYFHTAHQKEGWLNQGYEVQINNSHRGEGDYREVKKGGSLYGIRNLYKAYTKDSVWYNLYFKVEGKHIQIKVNDELVVDYTEPAEPSRAEKTKILSSGTFALQGHDPHSTVHFKNIRLRVLPDTAGSSHPVPATDLFPKMLAYQANHMPFIDFGIHADGPFNVDSAMQAYMKTGVNLGLVVDASKMEKGNENGSMLDFINRYLKYPVFVGVYRQNLAPIDSVNESTRDQFDYTIGNISTFKMRDGQDIDLTKEATIPNKQAFMDDYVKAIADALDKGSLSILSDATLLPTNLQSESDKLWTTERMLKVIESARRNNTAIGIDNRSKLPSIPFLKLAKEKGCLFAPMGLYADGVMHEPLYVYEVIDQCKLDYKDMYIPHNPN
jgi:hypothetical protein